MEQNSAVWPLDYPTSLWNYEKLSQSPDLPLMGSGVDWDFVLAFTAGVAIILAFAWRRFGERTFDPAVFEERVFGHLSPVQLRGSELMRGAYIRYAAALVLIYIALALFGNLVFQILNGFGDVAGLQFDPGEHDMRDPKWPLLLSLGMVGFLPMLPVLVPLERNLRAWAHHSAGIPIAIWRRSSALRSAFDATFEGEVQAEVQQQHLARIVAAGIADEEEAARALNIHAQLKKLTDWFPHAIRGWLTPQTASLMRDLEKECVEQAEVSVLEFEELLQPRPEVKASSLPWKGKKTGEGNEADTERARQRSIERRWTELTLRMRKHRNELLTILAVYAENQHTDDAHTFSRIGTRDAAAGTPNLRTILEDVFRDRPLNRGPETWILISLFGVFLIYAISIQLKFHALLSAIDHTQMTVIVSAIIETMKVAALLWLPLLAVLGWRRYRWEHGKWIEWSQWHDSMNDGGRPSLSRPEMWQHSAMNLVCAALMALFVSAALLAGVTMLRYALIATNEANFREILLSNGARRLLYYVSQAPIAAIQAVFVLCALGSRAAWSAHGGRSRLFIFGLANMGLIALFWDLHLAFWEISACREGTSLLQTVLTNLGDTECLRHYGGIEFLILSLLALVSAWWFIPIGDGEEWRQERRDTTSVPRTGAMPTAIGLLAACILLGASDPAQAQDGRKEVRLGFRHDAQPFSYHVGKNGDGQYKGFLVLLCQRIFDDDEWDKTIVPVTVTNRFCSFSPKGEACDTSNWDGEHVDVLCDPTTIRFDAIDGRNEGVYSPIVFVSGVSFMKRSIEENPKDVVIGYVAGSTAEDAAEYACKSDLFKVDVDRRLHQDGCASIGGDVNSSYRKHVRSEMERLLKENVDLQRQWFGGDASDKSYLTKLKIEEKVTEKVDQIYETDDGFSAGLVKSRTLFPDEKAQGASDTQRLYQLAGLAELHRDFSADLDQRHIGKCQRILLSDRLTKADGKPVFGEQRYYSCAFESHTEAIEWFCSKDKMQIEKPREAGSADATPTGFDPHSVERVYFGDRDIILAKLNTRDDDGECAKQATTTQEAFTYEPYALLIDRTKPELIRHVQRRVYEIFSDRKEILGFFTASFGEKRMAKTLADLFLLNAVEREDRFKLETDPASAGKDEGSKTDAGGSQGLPAPMSGPIARPVRQAGFTTFP